MSNNPVTAGARSYHGTTSIGNVDVVTEQWLPIPNYEGAYSVSNHGHVRSEPGKTRKGQTLKPYDGNRGYYTVRLSLNGRSRAFLVHRLVAAAFHGACPSNMEVRHLDGNPHNNVPANLRYGTSSENKLDIVEHGNHHQVRKTHCVNGHEFTSANLIDNHGHRGCRVCARVRGAEWARKHRAALRVAT